MIRIPNYEIGKMAGRGGAADVYLARHKLLDRTVAIKLISPAHADDLADKRFLKEAKVVAGLRHPNIVSIYDVGVYENKYYIIMEFLEGGDLKQNIRRGLSTDQSLKILRQIASALAHAHEKGFVHRDIKPQNIMFRADGTAVLTDFGIVKDLMVDTGYTLDGTSVGTPHYMSPEQAQGTGKIDWRTDLYSLGVTLYEMLTGSVPYKADSPVAVALKHIKDPVPRLPAEFVDYQPLINKLMAKKPEDRFQSVHDLLRAISEIEGDGLFDETLVLQPPSAKKINLINIFLGVALGCVLGGIFFFSYFYFTGALDRPQISVANHTPGHSQTGPLKWATEQKTLSKTSNPEWASAGADPLTQLIVKKKYSEAMDYIFQARKELPESSNEMMLKANQFLEAQQYMNAGDMFNTILSANPKNLSAILGLLYVTIEKQQRMVRAPHPTIAEFDTLLTLLNQAIINTNSQYFKHLKVKAVESVYEFALNHLKQGHFQDTDQWVKTGLKNAPEHLRLKKLQYLIQAQLSYEENRLTTPEKNNAWAYYQQILQLDPDDSDAKQGLIQIVEKYKTMAQADWDKKEYSRASQFMERARMVAPKDPELIKMENLILGDMYASMGQFNVPENKNARYFYKQILSQFPQDKDALLRIAQIEVLLPLYQIQQTSLFSKKIASYRTLFSNLNSVMAEHGRENTADLRDQVIQQIKADIAMRKRRKQAVPAEFMKMLARQFPNEKEILSTPYEILIAQGDESASSKDKSQYYLKALKLRPKATPARQKIKKLVSNLDHQGKVNEALSILQQAIKIVPAHAPFKKMAKTIRQTQNTKAEIFTLLLKIKHIQVLSEKVELYDTLFSKVKAAVGQFGYDVMTELQKNITEQIQSDIATRKNSQEPIPDTYMAMVKEKFSDLNDDAISAQYEIFMLKGDKSTSTQEKAEFYLSAFALDTSRQDAKSRIKQFVKRLDANGNNSEAVDILEKTVQIAPNDLMFKELLDNIQHTLLLYATDAGCGKRHMISQIPVSMENLNICVEYRNLPPNSVINIVVASENGHRMEIPVVLNEGAGTQVFDIPAPIEGFPIGKATIIAIQDKKILSETQIKFIPERR